MNSAAILFLSAGLVLLMLAFLCGWNCAMLCRDRAEFRRLITRARVIRPMPAGWAAFPAGTQPGLITRARVRPMPHWLGGAR